LRNGCDTWILDADIKGAFDNLSHEFILSAIGQVPGRELIKQWLRAGYVEAEIFHATTKGTPQGGTISPLLANIALDGMEKLLSSYTKVTIHQPSLQAKQQKPYKKKSNTYGFIRYADDFLVTAKTKRGYRSNSPYLEGMVTTKRTGT
jgi:RNA-directed DNA polymerase